MQIMTKKNALSDKNGTAFLSQRSSVWSLQCPNIYRLLIKKEGMLHSGKHGLVLTFLRFVAAIKFKMSWYIFYEIVKYLTFTFSMLYYEENIDLENLQIIAFCFFKQ